MEQNQPKPSKFALKYGVILGLLGIAFNLMLYFQDLHYQIDIQRILIQLVISLVLIVVVSVFAMRDFKSSNAGFMSIGQGLKIGIGLALISGVIGIIFSFILAEIIDPDMQEKAIAYAEQSLREAGMDQAQIDSQMEGQRDPNPIWQIAGGLFFSVILGFFGSIIPALALKKKPEEMLKS